jgi:hypothetical protein
MKTPIKSKISDFIYIFSLVLISSFLIYDFPFSLTRNFIWVTDGLLAQAQIQSIVDSGPFAKTNHLGYPNGFTQWSTPEFSLISAFLIWIFGNFSLITNFGLYLLVGVSSLFLNSFFVYLLVSLLTTKKSIIYVMTLVGLITPYAITQLGHPHVMPYFLPIFVLIYIINIDKNVFSAAKLFWGSILVILLSPLFWISVTIFLIFIITGIYLVLSFIDKHHKRELAIWGKLLLGFLLGFIPYLSLIFYHRKLNESLDRGTWHSDIFAGKFIDFILGSPFLNEVIPSLGNLEPGASTEAIYLRLGLTLSIAALITIAFAIAVNPKSNYLIRIRTFAVAAILLFLIGGLGNLQAGLFAFFELSSPMRSWGRVSIVIALIGLVLIVEALKNLKQIALYIALSLILVSSILDFISIEKANFDDNSQIQEQFESVAYLKENLSPCPVLQLPVDTYLLPQGHLDLAVRYYWSGKIPYILAPDFNWTASTYIDSKGWKYLTKIPTTVDKDSFEKISLDGYCAIYFDKDFSKYQQDRGASLDPSIGTWPGLLIDEAIKSDFEDSRFSVYLLNN